MALGLRYPGTHFQLGEVYTNPLNFYAFQNNVSRIVGTNGGIVGYADMASIMASPARYSSVRKVVFWANFLQSHNDPQPSFNVRLRVQPYSSTTTTRAIDSVVIPASSVVRTFGASAAYAQPGILNNESMLYPWSGSGNNLIPLKRGSGPILYTDAERHCQLIWTEFERFFPNSEEFFDDWDTIAAKGDDDEYVSFRVCIERLDGVAWNTAGSGDQTQPDMLSCGFAVIQAPGNPNDTCTYIPCTPAVYDASTSGATGPMQVIYEATGKSFDWLYRHADWDAITAINVHARHFPGFTPARNGGVLGARLFENGPPPNFTIATLTDEDLTDGVGTGTAKIARSFRFADWSSFITAAQDGLGLGVGFRSTQANTINFPQAHFEIIQKAFSKKATFFLGSRNHFAKGEGGPDANNGAGTSNFMIDKSLFDPLWYDNLTDEQILREDVYGNFKHLNVNNVGIQRVSSNADPDVNMITDPFTLTIQPSLSTTPAATSPGYRAVRSPITQNNHLRTAGKRTLKTEMAELWQQVATFDRPGSMGLVYVVEPGNSEFINLGPVFDVGAFNPEGCASTSAGLGDPGLLFITNGSTLPKKFDPRAQLIQDAGVPEPFEGETPQAVAGSTAASPVGGLQQGDYVYRYTFRNCCTGKESNPNPDDIEVDTSGASPAANVTLSFASVRIPADPQICEICIYRTSVGGAFQVMAKVGCFDPDDTSIFVDDLADSELDFFNEGLSTLNAPPPCTPIVVEFKNRLFWMGDIPDLAPVGTVSVENGSDLIVGDDDVDWDRCLVGKFIQIVGDCRGYEILRILPPVAGTSPPIQRLRLTEEYEGETNTGRSYTICGRPNRVYISEPLEGECVPEAGFLDVDPGDGDRLMGAVSNFDRIVICKRNKSYALTFRLDPRLEINVPALISKDIGCIGPRSFAQIESGSVFLADRGVSLYDGRSVVHVPESDQMNDMFINPDNDNYVRRDSNGRVIDAVGVFYPKREQYLLILPTKNTTRGSNLMLVWDVKLRNITILKFCQEFQAMVVAKDSDGNERVYLGDTNGFVWIYDIGDTDGVGFPNATGTVRGDISAVGTDDLQGASFLDDTSASFLTGGVPDLGGLSGLAGLSGALDGSDLGMSGACVFFRAKNAALDDPWTHKFVYAATKTRLYITPPWTAEELVDLAATPHEYMLGAIEFRCVFKPNNYGSDSVQKRDWDQIVVHDPETVSSQLRVELIPDFQNSDDEELTVVGSDGETGAGRTFDMSFPKGRQIRPVGRRIYAYEALRMTNFAPDEPIKVIQHSLRSTPRTQQ